MLTRNPRDVAHEILNSGKYLTQYEITFLKDIAKIVKRYGHLTAKQNNLLENIATKRHIQTNYKPHQAKPQVVGIMMNDLATLANKMTPADKTTFRKIIITHKRDGIDAVDKYDLFKLFRKYRENR